MTHPAHCPFCGAKPFQSIAQNIRRSGGIGASMEFMDYACAKCGKDYREASEMEWSQSAAAIAAGQETDSLSDNTSRQNPGEQLPQPESARVMQSPDIWSTKNPERNISSTAQTKYKFAVSLAGFLEVLLIIGAIVGILIAIAGFGSGGMFGMMSRNPPVVLRLMAAVPGMVISVVFLYMFVQTSAVKATIDSAIMTAEMLKIARAQASRDSHPPSGSPG